MAGLVTDPRLIEQLEAASAQAPAAPAPPAPARAPAPPAPSGRMVTDPVMIRRLEAQEAGYFNPSEGESFAVPGREYRTTASGIERRTMPLMEGKREPGIGGLLSSLKVTPWEPVSDEKELAEARKLAIENLPGMQYGGPAGAGVGERLATTGKQIGLDLLTDNQEQQADYLVKNFTKERGYTFVPVEGDRVMLVHKDPKTGKVTRQLVNAAGISAGDLVNIAPNVVLGVASGGVLPALNVGARMAAQGVLSGGLQIGRELVLKGTGDERDVDTTKIATETIFGALGEGVSSAISSAVKTNSAVRNFMEDLVSGKTTPPPMTPALRRVLTDAQIDPNQFMQLAGQTQKQIARPLVASEERVAQLGAPTQSAGMINAVRAEAGEARNTARQTARNVVDAGSVRTDRSLRPGDDPGVRINAFEATPNRESKAVFADMLERPVGDRVGTEARALRARSTGDMANPQAGTLAGGVRTAQTDIANVHGAVRADTAEEAIEQSSLALRGASTARRNDAQAAVGAADNDPLYRRDFTPTGMRSLVGDMTTFLRSKGYGTDPNLRPPAVREGLQTITNWLTSNSGTGTTETVRRALQDTWKKAPAGTSEKTHARQVLQVFDDWVDGMANTPGGVQSGAAGKLQNIVQARRQYADYVGSYRDNRPSTTMGETFGKDVAAVVDGLRTNPTATVANIIGAEGSRRGGMTPTRVDALSRLVRQVEDRIARPGANRQAQPLNARTPAAAGAPRDEELAWDGLRQAVWLRRMEAPEAFNTPAGRDIVNRLYTPEERTLAGQLDRIRGMIGSVEDVRSLPSRTQRERTLERAKDFARYLYKYRAVRDLHKHGPIAAVAQAAGGIFALRGITFLERFAASSLLRGAENPMKAVRGVVAPVSESQRLSGFGIVEAMRNAIPGEPSDTEKRILEKLEAKFE
jgi:hypothetical protein